jgi:hypothetical protein
MELETDGVDGEGAARQPGPLDRAFALLDPLLRCAGKADTRVKLIGMPLDLRHEVRNFFQLCA